MSFGSIFKKVAKGIGADINPFDHGASQGNMNPQARIQQQTLQAAGFQNQAQQRAYQQQAVHNLGLRYKAGQISPASYHAGITAALATGNTAENSNTANVITAPGGYKKDPALQSAENGFSNGLIKYASPQSILGSTAEFGGKVLNNHGLENWGHRTVQPVRELGQMNEAEGNKLAYKGGNIAGTLLASTLVPGGAWATDAKGALTIAGRVVPLAVNGLRFGLTGAADTSNAIKEGGGSRGAQILGGAGSGIVQGGIGALSTGTILGKVPIPGVNSAVGRIIAAGAGGATENVTQTLADNIIAKHTYDPTRSLGSGVKEAAITGAVLSGATHAATELSHPEVRANVKETASNIKDKAGDINRRVEASGHPQLQELNHHYDQLNKQWQTAGPVARKQIEKAIAANRTEYNKTVQGGYVKNPFYKAGEQSPSADGNASGRPLRVDTSVPGTSNESIAVKSDISPKIFTPLKEDPKYPNSYIPAKLPDVVNDSKLFEKYPDLKDVTVKYHSPGTEAPGLTGKYDPKTKTISLPYDTPDTTKIGSIIHEIQHAIQDTQGRAEKTRSSDFHEYANHPLEVEAEAKSNALKDQYKTLLSVTKNAPTDNLSPEFRSLISNEPAKRSSFALQEDKQGNQLRVRVNQDGTALESFNQAKEKPIAIKPARNPEAERGVVDGIKNGSTTDEIIYNYMKSTGSNLQTAADAVERVAKESGLAVDGTTNKLRGTVNVTKAKSAGDARLNADYVVRNLNDAREGAAKAVSSLSEHDLELLKDIETAPVDSLASKAENPQFKEHVATIRKYYDLRDAWDNRLGVDHKYRFNYLRQLVDAPSETAGPLQARGGSQKPGYVKARSQETLRTNALDALDREAGAIHNLGKLTYREGLTNVYGDKIANGELLRGDNGTYKTVETKYGSGITASPEVADEINRRAAAKQPTGALATYDKVNAGLKLIKLGGGGFHALTEAGNFVGQQLTSGKLFTEPSATAKAVGTFFSKNVTEHEMTRMQEAGVVDNAALAGLTTTPKEVKADVSTTPKGKVVKVLGIKALHDATFGREIPYMKLKTFEQKTAGLDRTVPADVAQMREIAKGINDEFGGINRSQNGITPQNAKRLSRVLLASDFTESKVNTLISALSKGGEQGRLARETVIGKALLFGGLAAGAGFVGGEDKDKSAKDTAATIAAKLIDPSFSFGTYHVGLPGTHISEFTKPFKSFFDGNSDPFYGIKHYATARLAAVPSEVNQLINNQDYKGAKIYGGTKTKPISPGQAALNIASGVLPINVGNAVSTGTGQQNIAAGVANTVGLSAYEPAVKNTSTSSDGSKMIKIGSTSVPKGQTVKVNGVDTDINSLPLGDKITAQLKNLETGDIQESDVKGSINEIGKIVNSWVPAGLPNVKSDTILAKDWASFDARQKSGKANSYSLQTDKNKILVDAYQRIYGRDTSDLFHANNADIFAAAQNGSLQKQQMDNAVTLDNALVNAGLKTAPSFSNTLRAQLGYDKAPSKTKTTSTRKSVKIGSLKLKAYKTPRIKMVSIKKPKSRKIKVASVKLKKLTA